MDRKCSTAPYAGGPNYIYTEFYPKNLAVTTDFLSSTSGTLTGVAKGTGEALSDAWSLISDLLGTSDQLSNGLMGLTKNPWGTFASSVEASQTKAAMATIYDMQGNTAAAAAIRAKSDIEFALNFLPANRARTLAELGAGAKGTGAVVDDTIKALPAPRQIDASWSASTYNNGGLMTGSEYVFYRHGPDSGFANVSKFSQGTSVKDVSSYVDDALRYGKVTPNGPGGHVIEYNAGKVIGTNVSGAPTSTIKINVRDGVIRTAFPY